jgi:hypothetical protein
MSVESVAMELPAVAEAVAKGIVRPDEPACFCMLASTFPALVAC